MKFLYALLIVQFCWLTTAYAQPSNEDCHTAIEITDPNGYCSNVEEFTNINATPSTVAEAPCFDGSSNDVWFSFTAVATAVTITVIGDTDDGAGGTLEQPEVALYTGSCSESTFDLQTLQCGSDDSFFHDNIIQIFRGGIEVGLTYFIRVQGVDDETGTFQLCVNNYNPPNDPGSDCIVSSILCDKSSFVVQQIDGAGNDPDEAGDSSCLGGLFGTSENSSTWFAWTAANDGSLTFDLVPLNPSDDLDFVLYELPAGATDCTDKIEVRCMASGSFDFPSNCSGPTGLNETSTDVSEPASCDDPTQDNYLAALQMVEGTSYALLVNNFSDTGNGFEISFGGTGEFVGPQAAFFTDPPSNETACIGSSITFTDASSFLLGSIVDWEWNFGSDATPMTATGPGPHAVTFATPGVKNIVLSVTSDEGCIVTEIQTITVECCDIDLDIDADIVDIACPGDTNGSIDLTVTNDFPPYGFEWSTGDMTEDIGGLTEGDYTVTITDEATCDTVVTFTIMSSPPLIIDPIIVMPTCGGGTDGSIEIQTSGGTPPYLYSFNNGAFDSSNTLANISQGDYDVIIRDDNGCEEMLTVEVRELELILDPNVASITQPSCFGFSDGSITVNITNGLPPYQYDFNDGNGFVNENSLDELSAGTFMVNVIDANLCEGNFTFLIEDHPPLTLTIDATDVGCFGANNGTATATVTGGVGNYTYTWSNGQSGDTADGLNPGTFGVTVLDGNGCEIIGETTVVEPGLLTAAIVDVADVFCFGEATGGITAGVSGGSPPFQYSVDGVFFQDSPQFTGLEAGTYTVYVQDDRDCIATIDATILQPDQLAVNVGQDLMISLGFDANLNAQVTPLGHEVTYSWTPPDSLSCANCPNPTAEPTNTITYTVMVTDSTGCSATDELTITVSKERPIYAPNAFSPDNDGVNDFFTLFSGPAARTIRTLRVFDRWGELLFDGTNVPLGKASSGWDGTFRDEPMGTGVYTWYAEIEFVDNQVIIYEGDITIVR